MYTPPALSPNRIRNDYTLRYWILKLMNTVTGFLSVPVPGIPVPARLHELSSVLHMIYRHGWDPHLRSQPGWCRFSPLQHELISDPGGGIRIAGSALDEDVAGKPSGLINRHR